MRVEEVVKVMSRKIYGHIAILMKSMIKMKGAIPGREGRLACHTLGTWGLQEDPKT